MKMNQATVYSRKTRFFVHASSETTAGVWILSAPTFRLDRDSSDADLGRAVRAALEGSKSNVPHPRVWKGLFDPILKEAGVGSWAAFTSGAQCALVEQDSDSALVVTPTVNRGAAEGFKPIPAEAVLLEAPTAEAIGGTIRSILNKAKAK
jgi:hypothetical protein